MTALDEPLRMESIIDMRCFVPAPGWLLGVSVPSGSR